MSKSNKTSQAGNKVNNGAATPTQQNVPPMPAVKRPAPKKDK